MSGNRETLIAANESEGRVGGMPTPDAADEHTTLAPGSSPGSPSERPAWYHADFCHAAAWVYEEGDHLRVAWFERTGSDLYLHSKTDCDRCTEIRKDEHLARDGEFTMAKPPEEFSSMESFMSVLVEIAGFVPGLIDEDES